MHSYEWGIYPDTPCYSQYNNEPQCLSIQCGIDARARLDKCLLTHNEIDPVSYDPSGRKLKMPSSDLNDFLDYPGGPEPVIDIMPPVDVLIPPLEPLADTPLELEQPTIEKIETIFVPQITERFTIQREKSDGKLEKFIIFGVIGLALFLLK